MSQHELHFQKLPGEFCSLILADYLIQKKKKKKSSISTALRMAIYFRLTLLMQLHKIEGKEFITGYVRIKYRVLSHQAPQTVTKLLRSSLLPAGESLLSEEIRTTLAVCISVFVVVVIIHVQICCFDPHL